MADGKIVQCIGAVVDVEFPRNAMPKVFDALKPFLTAGKGAIPYAQAATAVGMSEGAVRVAVHRLRQRYRQLLRDEISQTLADPAQADEEMRALFEAFA